MREMAETDESFSSRFSHWTYRLCPKKSISQIHLTPSALTDDEDAADGDMSQSLKLPPNSLLSNSIQFLLPTVNNLGTYLTPLTPDYESLISAAWGPDETKAPIPYGLVEYYIGGDICKGSRKRQSKIIYELECCKRRQSMMEEFFQNDGQIMIQSVAEPEPCRYILKACNICPVDEVRGNETLDTATETSPSVHPSGFEHMLQTFLQYPPIVSETGSSVGGAFPPMPPSQIEANKQLLHSMFTHAYDSYFYNAFPASELKPLTCQPGVFNLVRIPALTLIDTLDTFIIMGNYTEFARSVERLRYLDERMKREFQAARGKSKDDNREGEEGGLFSVNQNVSLFETTIRVLGGLLSAHQLALAFMENLVPKSDVWDSSGDVLSGNYTTSIVSDVEMESTKDDEDVSSTVDVAHEGASVDGDGDSHSCLWESSSCPNAQPGVIDGAEEGCGCKSEIDAANKKKKGKNATSSVSRRNATPTWEYDGFLLELAHDIGKRLLFAFDTETGIPYGTVNLLHGIPPGETPVASLAGAGTLSLEFELLSRLIGDQSFGKAAKLATRALWVRRSPHSLFGKHIDSHSGAWKEYLSGVGSNSDSFYEYLIKHYLLFPDDSDFWTMFLKAYSGVHDNSRLGEWYVDVDMGSGLNGQVRQVFESLMAFYPGLQVLLGELVPSAKTLNSFFLVREFLGLLPERFNFAQWKSEGGDVHPLRPELLESCYFLHLASIGLHGSKRGPCSNASSSHHTSSWLWAADFALAAVHKLSWTPCGFATVTNVAPTTTGGLDFVGDSSDPLTQQQRLNIQHHNEMPSYFLSETIKYLYLTFDAENNILHNDERAWIFTTEAHPIHYVPVSNSTMHGDDRINAQLDQVRSLLKESMLDSPPSIPSMDEIFTANASSVVPSFEHEQWSEKTPESIFVASIHNVEREVVASKHETAGIHDFKSGPPFQRELFSPDEIASYGIFSSEISAINQAHYQFESHGNSGNGLGKRCPNYHHPDLQWAHALHGDSLDYNTAHSSSVSNDATTSNDGVDERMLTALASICFYGTDFYDDGIRLDKDISCPIEEAPEDTANFAPSNTKKNNLQPSTSTSIPGATRYDMGGSLGMFDVSAFPGGDGFVVQHVASEELLEVSIFHDDAELSPGETATVILVVLTTPPPQPVPSPTEPQNKHRPNLYDRTTISWRSSEGSWGRRLNGDSVHDDSFEEDTKPEPDVDDDYERHVVVADLETNSFKCEVVLTKNDSEVAENQSGEFLSNFPCSPAFFGRSHMPNLRRSGGEIVKGQLHSPPPGDELGCRPADDAAQLDQHDSCQGNVSGENNVLQMVRRGDCNFMRKAANHRHSEGIIVINSNPSELFVMAGEKTQPGSNSGCSNDDLPVSVLVSGQDGASIIQILRDEESKGNEVNALIQLLDDNDTFPHVEGSKEALNILASNGWGIHAVPQDQDLEKHGWQLFITQHDKKM
eukprot:CAMPEP_0172332452 /NCGR_PEP_ID=MMETSP1058-20130122/62443_1 /TAXON_ID=83371 /ORGANISM="Detonula confervacea, Strain CCMP 353" /LENGTH=1455 /DNA_ID=CAMNT_0013049737 /DNA_START=662 /DNA_END=5029 /DNA_ORIENTATION=-